MIVDMFVTCGFRVAHRQRLTFMLASFAQDRREAPSNANITSNQSCSKQG